MSERLPYVPAHAGRPVLLASDIDGTLLGDELGQRWLHEFTARHPGALVLVYVSGRSVGSVLGLVAEGRLPMPRCIAGQVGTELLDCQDDANRLDADYAAQAAGNWDRAAVLAAGCGEGVVPQPVEPGARVRFHAGFLWDGAPETLDGLRRRLAGFSRIQIHPCYGQYIDVFPEGMNKGLAARFIQSRLGFPDGRTVVAGDSGNDRTLILSGLPAILPSNSLEELRLIATAPHHHHSRLPAARGVLDGLRHFGHLAVIP
jgi:hydroxymethylpyrimidine pyrophosphatase-like HAD family hydrolase